jgi:phospholipid transport system substrate-binding protein
MTVRIVQGLAAVLLALATLAADRPAWAGPPSDQLRAHVERVTRVLEDPELRREGRLTERRAGIRRIANEIFDFNETTRRSLGQHWQARTPQEREEIVGLYTDLLERSYIGKIEMYTRLVTKAGTEVPVDYRMHRVGEDRWLAYDVAVEGVSMVADYRAQFNKIIQTSGYKSLVSKLAAKQEEGLESDRELTIRKASQTK